MSNFDDEKYDYSSDGKDGAERIRINESSEGYIMNSDGILETVIPEKEIFTPARDYNLVGLGFTLFMVIWYVIVFIATFAVYMVVYNGKGDGITVAEAATISLVSEILALIPFALLTRKIKYTPLKQGGEKFGFRDYLKYLCMIFSFSIIGSIISNIINNLIVSLGGEASTSDIGSMVSGNYRFMLIFTVLVGPALEELMCRKLVVDHIYKYGKLKAMIVSGVLFALLHGNVEQYIYTFLIGCLLAYVYIKTGKLRNTIILHMSLNAYSMLLMFLYGSAAKAAGAGSIQDLIAGGGSDAVQKLTENETALIYLGIAGIVALAEYIMAFIGVIYLLTHLNTFAVSDEKEQKFPLAKTVFAPLMIVGYLAAVLLPVVVAYI